MACIHVTDPDGAVDYESLPLGLPTTTYMIAGSLAGIMEHCVMFPFDSVKTRMQSLVTADGARGPFRVLKMIVQQEGFFRPIRGMPAMILGAGPAHAMYFAAYEQLKSSLSTIPFLHHSSLGIFLAGAACTLLHDSVMTPADAIKQRMQMRDSPYRSTFHCMMTMYRTEGTRAFYRSFSAQVVMNIPFQASHFVVYEASQDLFNTERRYIPITHIVSGALAGGIAAAITTPLDVCKTVLNTQEFVEKVVADKRYSGPFGEGGKIIRGLPQAFMTVYRYKGVLGYFQGVQARIIGQMPATAISWSTYEFFKSYISKRKNRCLKLFCARGLSESSLVFFGFFRWILFMSSGTMTVQGIVEAGPLRMLSLRSRFDSTISGVLLHDQLTGR